MTGIGPYGTAALAARRADETFQALKGRVGSLQDQLATGKAAPTYAGVAPGALLALSARSRLSSLAATQANVTDATLRVKVAAQGLEQIDTLASSLRVGLPATLNPPTVGQTGAVASAADGLRQVVEILNTDIDGRYLFSGRAADQEPVAAYGLLVDGDGSRAGLRQVIAERKAADRGSDGLGRLTVSGTGTGVSLAEEAAGLPYGLKIAAASATGTGITAARAAGPPASAAVEVSAQPAAGDAVTLTLGLPDGTAATVTLTAAAAGATPSTNPDGTAATFALGADPAGTAANLRAALTGALGALGATTLASASAATASAAFFAGSASNPPVRVDGPPFDTATATRPGTADDTVIAYRGDDATGSPRETAPVGTGDGTGVAIGFRANEAPFRSILAAFGALAGDTFPPADPTAATRYAAAAGRAGPTIDLDGLRDSEADLATAAAALGSASGRIASATAQAHDLVDGVEAADPAEAATKLLDTQTRLQASYQATATIAKLSLVNFL